VLIDFNLKYTKDVKIFLFSILSTKIYSANIPRLVETPEVTLIPVTVTGSRRRSGVSYQSLIRDLVIRAGYSRNIYSI
jgi:hypothetical protein